TEPPLQEPGERFRAAHGDQLVERHWLATERIGELRDHSEAQHPAAARHVPRALDTRAAVDPRAVEAAPDVDPGGRRDADPDAAPVADGWPAVEDGLEAQLGGGGVLSVPRRFRVLPCVDPLLDGGIVAAGIVAEDGPVDARLRLQSEDPVD